MKNRTIAYFYAFILVILTGFTGTLKAQSSAIYNLRSDTVDVLHYEVNLEITDFSTNQIYGSTRIQLSPKISSIQSVCFDLLALNVDSVKYNGTSLTFLHNDTVMTCYFASPINDADTINVYVYYHGTPVADPTWGGFYFQSGYAYNLGVGFTSVPHNFGRVFHPCFDNFTERATYTFNITTTGGKVAYCNGLLTNNMVVGPNVLRTWEIKNSIPSYLATVSVNNYTHVNQQYVSPVTGDTTPIMLISLPADTTNFKGSFINLPNAMIAYEQNYGPYEWEKIGYVAVPFSAGAMEHATCISYPRATLTGGTTYQTLMAHELSHHWWGDLVTCETAEEMWINEGMARWSEALFLEHLSGYSAYMSDLRPNHKQVVYKAHVDDGGFHALNGVPQNVTYGTTTYNKGADVVHTMRGYLGDSLFFLGLKTVLANNKFKNINTAQFRDWMNTVPGINVTDFFNDWVMQPGFPEFAIDSVVAVADGANYDITIYSKQKLRGALHLANNVPMQVMFRNNAFQSYSAKVSLSGANQVSTVQDVPFLPDVAYFNDDEKISEAVTAHQTLITSNGIKSFSNANFNFNVGGVADTVWARVEHHWVAADAFIHNDFMYTISPDRFWRVYMLGDVANFYTKGNLTYNGTTGGSGYLDNGLMVVLATGTFNEDSLRLFYRKDAGENWTVCPNVTFTTGSKTDKQGSVLIDSLRPGDYALGIKSSAVGISEVKNENMLSVFPNPTTGEFTIEYKGQSSKNDLKFSVVDTNGALVSQGVLTEGKALVQNKNLAKGVYYVQIKDKKKQIATRKIIIQ